MSYIEAICEPLIATLGLSLILPSHQLAGYAANLEFWLSEAKHCIQVIDGYEQRFERMKSARQFQAEIEGIQETPLQRGVASKKIKAIRQQVDLATSQFLQRCYEEHFIDEKALQAHQEKLV